MHIPNLQKIKTVTETLDYFLGLNHNLRPGRGELYGMKNLSSDLCPVLSPRKRRTILKTGVSIQGMGDAHGLCTVEENRLFINGKQTDLMLSSVPEDQPRQLITMGAWLIILPDRKYINTGDLQDFGSIDAEVRTSAPVCLCQCTLDGQEIHPGFSGAETPESPEDRSWWLDYDNKTLKQYSASTGLWVTLETPYVKLQCPGIGKPFEEYDGVKISGDPGLEDLAGAAILHGVGQDHVIFPGLIRENQTLFQPVKITRKMPELDYCIECGNRLWGCRYGLNAEGRAVNELYCSKLGDFKNWNTYLGISTDSYTCSLGSAGPFTGAVAYGGYPLFFKEDCLHKVFGSMPSNFSVQTTACRGVQQGCSRSLSIADEVLYYKARGAVCAYDGSLPRDISEPLGKEEYGRAVAASCHGKYYISMEQGEGSVLLVYDVRRGLWHQEDDLGARFLCRCRQGLYCADREGRLLELTGTAEGEKEEEVSWMAESGIIGVTLPGNKYLSRISLRMLLNPGSTVTVKVQYDSQGPFKTLGTVTGMHLRSFVIPVVPRRCDHLRLRLEGRGRGLLFSVTRILSFGGEGG